MQIPSSTIHATLLQFRQVILILLMALFAAGGRLAAQNVITRNVVVGGTFDASPISTLLPPGDFARMLVMHTTVPGTSLGTMFRTQFGVETVWGTGGSEPFGPAAAPSFTQNRISGTQGFRYTSNGTGVGQSESIPVRFVNLSGGNATDYTLVINIVPPAGAPQITTQPIPLQSVPPGVQATMTVVATGNAPLSYQWYEGLPPSTLTPMAGATGATFNMPGRTVGQYHFWVRVSNSISSVNSLGATVNVSNPPTARPGGPYTVAENEAITLSGLASTDPDQPSNTLSYKWDNDGNSIYGLFNTTYGPEVGATPLFTAVDLEGPGTHPLGLQVSDNSDNLAYASTTITIVNAPPRAVFTTNGAPGVVSFSNIFDTTGDTAAGFQFSYDLNGDGTFEVPYGPAASVNVPPAFMAAYLDGQPVRGRVRDRDDGVSEYWASVHGRGVVVTTLTDENNGGSWELGRIPTSLREAIGMANADALPGVVFFDPALLVSSAVSIATNSPLTITTPVAVCGPVSGNGVTLQGTASLTRCFNVTSTGTLILDRLTIRGYTAAQWPGESPSGGAVLAAGPLTARRSTFEGNSATASSSDPGTGGAIHASGVPVILENCTFTGNQATSTSGPANGGAIYARNAALTLANCTLSGNSASGTRALHLVCDTPGQSASAFLRNTIIAQADIAGLDFRAEALNGAAFPATSGSHNIIRSSFGFSGSFIAADPRLGPLADNGGPTRTLAPLAFSPAINKGMAIPSITMDQRGTARPFARCYDIGAVEASNLVESLVVTTLTDEDDCTSDAFTGTGTSLREALYYAETKPGADTITFAPGLTGNITLGSRWAGATTESALEVHQQDVSIIGPATAPGITLLIGGGQQYRHFFVYGTGSLSLRYLTLKSGSAADYGGSVWSMGSLTVQDCFFASNYAGAEGGAIQSWGGSPLCQIVNCTFNGNTTAGIASAINAGATLTRLWHLTVSNNSGTSGTGDVIVLWGTSAEMRNCIVAGNNNDGIGLLNGATLNAQSTHNILGGGPTGGLSSGTNGNLTGIPLAALQLSPPAPNGGAASSMALGPASIATNLGAAIPGVTTDQRGTARTVGSAPDVGAFEDTLNNGAGDADLDTLGNYAEFTGGTSLTSIDSDTDGFNDPTELMADSNPLSSAGMPGTTHVSRVLGFGPSRGLDLDGTFRYAVNVGTNPAPGAAGSANFTSDSVSGVSVSAANEIPAWNAPEFGTTGADNSLENVFRSIRWSPYPSPVTVSLANLTPGRNYKLQLLFGEACCQGRTFDVLVEGAVIADNFAPAAAQGGIPVRYAGSAVVHEFVALDNTLNIVLDAGNVPVFAGLDRNPILNGLTLEEGSFISSLAEWRALHSLPADGSLDFANPSGDGLGNIVRYAFNLAPLAGDLNKPGLTTLPPGGTAGLPFIRSTTPGGPLVFDFIRRKASSGSDIFYIPQTSSDISAWTPLGAAGAAITSIDTVWERVSQTAPAGSSRQFGRVEVCRASYANDFALLPLAALRGSAAIVNGSLRLTESINGQAGSAVLEAVAVCPGQTGFDATFHLQTGPTTTGTPADGISFVVGDPGTAPWGENGPGTPHSLTIAFDTYENSAGPGNALGIRLVVNGTSVASHPYNPYTSGQFVPVTVNWRAGAVTVVFNGTTIFNNLAVSGFALQAGDRYGFGGRTGGLNELNLIDNVVIQPR